jgi:hypothetical protein
MTPHEFWALDSKPQYPRTIEEWSALTDAFEVQFPRPTGVQDFDLTLNPMARANPLSQFVRLLDRFPMDFLAASKAFDAVEWRLLYYARSYYFANLGQPDFDAIGALQLDCPKVAGLDEIPSELLGTDASPAEVALGMYENFHELSVDQAKAVWAILAFVWSIRLERYEVLQLPWWDYHWLLEFVRHARVAA